MAPPPLFDSFDTETIPQILFTDIDFETTQLNVNQIFINPDVLTDDETAFRLSEETMRRTSVLPGKPYRGQDLCSRTDREIAAAVALLFPELGTTGSKVFIKARDMEKVTVCVEREFRDNDAGSPSPTDCVYQANIHERFGTPETEDATKRKILGHDESGGEILIGGPYAPSAESAVEAL